MLEVKKETMNGCNVAVWGLGLHAIKNILPALRVSPGINLYGVCSRHKGSLSEVSSDLGCRAWSDPSLMLLDSNIDVVYLATPIGVHAVQGMAVLSAGKHLWCEKPLASNQTEVMELLELSRATKRVVAEAYMYLYHPQFDFLRDTITSGLLGSVQNVTCRFGIPPLDRPGFRNDPQLGGGAFLDVGSYLTSAVVALFPDQVASVLYSYIEKGGDSSVDTGGSAFLCHETHTNITLEWGINRAYRNEIDVWGTLASVSCERLFSKPADYIPKFRFLDLNGRESFKFCSPANHFVRMFEAFRTLLEDEAEHEKTRVAIAQRAHLMNEINKVSNLRS
jgi:dTDP-3,4-didehydro-2,6-dideoxy-alpha-D-glucose 3-reductase